MLREILERLRAEGLAAIEAAETSEILQELRQKLLGKKGSLTQELKNLGALPAEERRSIGQLANEIKELFQRRLDEKEEEKLAAQAVLAFQPDLSLPGIKTPAGGLHPITQMRYDLDDAFRSLNFHIAAEDEITSESYAFDYLNFPPAHPARESMDTYWLAGAEDKAGDERLCLRPHLTGGSVRYLQEHGAPARFVYPGRVYRNETTDARHDRAFFQYEALIVEKEFAFASGRLLIDTILRKVFGQKVETRMRAGFFPFVEPGFEIDMKCLVCGGAGCRVCKQVGWIEVMPGGTPHPNVLRAAGLDPEIWTGFYIDIGLDRLVMMRYGVDDVRLFHSGDLRFLEQFS